MQYKVAQLLPNYFLPDKSSALSVILTHSLPKVHSTKELDVFKTAGRSTNWLSHLMWKQPINKFPCYPKLPCCVSLHWVAIRRAGLTLSPNDIGSVLAAAAWCARATWAGTPPGQKATCHTTLLHIALPHFSTSNWLWKEIKKKNYKTKYGGGAQVTCASILSIQTCPFLKLSHFTKIECPHISWHNFWPLLSRTNTCK